MGDASRPANTLSVQKSSWEKRPQELELTLDAELDQGIDAIRGHAANAEAANHPSLPNRPSRNPNQANKIRGEGWTLGRETAKRVEADYCFVCLPLNGITYRLEPSLIPPATRACSAESKICKGREAVDENQAGATTV